MSEGTLGLGEPGAGTQRGWEVKEARIAWTLDTMYTSCLTQRKMLYLMTSKKLRGKWDGGHLNRGEPIV